MSCLIAMKSEDQGSASHLLMSTMSTNTDIIQVIVVLHTIMNTATAYLYLKMMLFKCHIHAISWLISKHSNIYISNSRSRYCSLNHVTLLNSVRLPTLGIVELRMMRINE